MIYNCIIIVLLLIIILLLFFKNNYIETFYNSKPPPPPTNPKCERLINLINTRTDNYQIDTTNPNFKDSVMCSSLPRNNTMAYDIICGRLLEPLPVGNGEQISYIDENGKGRYFQEPILFATNLLGPGSKNKLTARMQDNFKCIDPSLQGVNYVTMCLNNNKLQEPVCMP